MVACGSRGDTSRPDIVGPPSSIALEWHATATYNAGNIVRYEGALYQATAARTSAGVAW
jgi:hypothetical protein